MRLALGLHTVLPVGAVRIDRRTARDAMLAALLVGLLPGAAARLTGALVHAAGGGSLLAAVAASAAATRALHLDGPADLADGLGSRRPAEGPLAVMRRSDVGPFGLVTLVLVLLAQVGTLVLAQAWDAGHAGSALLLMGATGRLALSWACREGAPAARPDGMGVLVAATVTTNATNATTALLLLAFLGWGLSDGAWQAVAYGASLLAGTLAGLLLLRHAVARLGVHGWTRPRQAPVPPGVPAARTTPVPSSMSRAASRAGMPLRTPSTWAMPLASEITPSS